MRRVKFCSVTRGRAETDDVMCKILVHNTVTTDKNAYLTDPHLIPHLLSHFVPIVICLQTSF